MSVRNILDGTIKVEAPIPDPLKVDQVKAGEISASYAVIKEATIPTLSTSALSADKLAINGRVVLNTLNLNDTTSISAVSAVNNAPMAFFSESRSYTESSHRWCVRLICLWWCIGY